MDSERIKSWEWECKCGETGGGFPSREQAQRDHDAHAISQWQREAHDTVSIDYMDIY